MTDYSEFEASIKSGIQADPKRIKRKDEIIKHIMFIQRIFLYIALGLIGIGIVVLKWSWIPSVILWLAAAFCLWKYIGREKFSDSDLKDFYEEGLLVPGLIVKTEPLTILAIASLVAYDGGPDRTGCYNLQVKELEGAKGQLYEKVPCSCMFRYESGNYHSAFQPHPLYWGTSDKQAIEQALMTVERSNLEEAVDEWEVLKQVAEQFPDLKDEEMILLDENYKPIGRKYYWSDDYTCLEAEEKNGNKTETESVQTRPHIYKKQDQQEILLEKDVPGKEVYNNMIKLACRLKVYDYISGHCESGRITNYKHPGLFTYIGDPISFLEELHEDKTGLQQGEYPLILEKYLITTRGCYVGKRLLPWNEVEFSVKFNFENGIKLYMNGKKIAEFVSHLEGYSNWEQMTEEEKKEYAKKESDRLLEFLGELRNLQ